DVQHVDRARVLPLLLVWWEELAQIAEATGPEQGVDHGMGEHIGVGMPGEAPLVFDLHPADHQPLPGLEAMAVIADAHPKRHQPCTSSGAGIWAPLPALPSGSRRRSRRSKTQISSTPSVARNSIASS